MNNLELAVPLPLPLGGSPGMPSPALAEVAVCGFCEFSIFRIRRQRELTESENLRVRHWRCRVTQKSERKPQRRDV